MVLRTRKTTITAARSNDRSRRTSLRFFDNNGPSQTGASAALVTRNAASSKASLRIKQIVFEKTKISQRNCMHHFVSLKQCKSDGTWANLWLRWVYLSILSSAFLYVCRNWVKRPKRLLLYMRILVTRIRLLFSSTKFETLWKFRNLVEDEAFIMFSLKV